MGDVKNDLFKSVVKVGVYMDMSSQRTQVGKRGGKRPRAPLLQFMYILFYILFHYFFYSIISAMKIHVFCPLYLTSQQVKWVFFIDFT